jgi:dihydroxyacetone kinase-like protein
VTPPSDAAEPGRALTELINAVAIALAARRDTLNRLDGAAGDGDLGVTVTLAAEAIAEIASRLRGMSTPDALRLIGTEIAARAPSTAGTLVAFAFLAAGRVGDVDGATGGVAAIPYLEAAARSIEERGRVAVGDRTIVDALRPAVDAFRSAIERGEPVEAAARAAASAADQGAALTASMTLMVGRAAWLAERARGHEDAGARLVAMAFEAAAAYLTLGSAPSEGSSG